jgi:hydrogenase maturation protease
VNGFAERVLILGIGNVLMGDEGVGVHAIRFLERETFPPSVRLLDGGTGGFTLLSYLQEYPSVIMIDATMDGKPPGSITVLRPKFASEFPRALSAHDIGLRDLVETAILTGRLPEIHLITVSISKIQPMQMELSTELSPVIPRIGEKVRQILESLGGEHSTP